MLIQSISIPIITFLAVNFRPSDTPWAMWSCHALVYATLIVTVWSGLPYITGLRRILSEKKDAAP